MHDSNSTPAPPTPTVSPALAMLRPRVCIYCRQVCTEQTGAYAVRSRTRGVAAACGPCFARRYGADHPHGHPVGRRCPVCASTGGQQEVEA